MARESFAKLLDDPGDERQSTSGSPRPQRGQVRIAESSLSKDRSVSKRPDIINPVPGEQASTARKRKRRKRKPKTSEVGQINSVSTGAQTERPVVNNLVSDDQAINDTGSENGEFKNFVYDGKDRETKDLTQRCKEKCVHDDLRCTHRIRKINKQDASIRGKIRRMKKPHIHHCKKHENCDCKGEDIIPGYSNEAGFENSFTEFRLLRDVLLQQGTIGPDRPATPKTWEECEKWVYIHENLDRGEEFVEEPTPSREIILSDDESVDILLNPKKAPFPVPEPEIVEIDSVKLELQYELAVQKEKFDALERANDSNKAEIARLRGKKPASNNRPGVGYVESEEHFFHLCNNIKELVQVSKENCPYRCFDTREDREYHAVSPPPELIGTESTVSAGENEIKPVVAGQPLGLTTGIAPIVDFVPESRPYKPDVVGANLIWFLFQVRNKREMQVYRNAQFMVKCERELLKRLVAIRARNEARILREKEALVAEFSKLNEQMISVERDLLDHKERIVVINEQVVTEEERRKAHNRWLLQEKLKEHRADADRQIERLKGELVARNERYNAIMAESSNYNNLLSEKERELIAVVKQAELSKLELERTLEQKKNEYELRLQQQNDNVEARYYAEFKTRAINEKWIEPLTIEASKCLLLDGTYPKYDGAIMTIEFIKEVHDLNKDSRREVIDSLMGRSRNTSGTFGFGVPFICNSSVSYAEHWSWVEGNEHYKLYEKVEDRVTKYCLKFSGVLRKVSDCWFLLYEKVNIKKPYNEWYGVESEFFYNDGVVRYSYDLPGNVRAHSHFIKILKDSCDYELVPSDYKVRTLSPAFNEIASVVDRICVNNHPLITENF